jgi:EmrB/QacA subfamily drug resistance transporter
VAVVYISAQLMAAVDMQIVNVTIPTLSHQFHAPLADVQWTTISYLLALAVIIPASAWIGDRVGIRRMLIVSLALFTAASALCGLAGSLMELIAARALQGMGGGMLISSGLALLYRTFPARERARIARLVLLPVLIGPAAAPVLGGVLTESLSWRWVFLVNIPPGVATLLFASKFLPSTPRIATEPLDVPGLLLSALGLCSLLYAVSEGSAFGWGSSRILGTGIGGIVLLVLFTRHSLRRPNPILRIDLLRDRLFRAMNIVFALTTGPFLGSLYLTPIFLQETLHQTPIGSGTTTFLEAVGVGIGAQTLGRLYPRLGPSRQAAVGASLLTVYLGLFLLVGPHTSLWLVRALMLLGGVGNSACFLAVQTAMFTTISRADMSHASAIYNTQRQSSIALNVAVLTTIVAGAGAGSTVAAFHDAYLAAAVIAGVGTLCALTLIHTRDARATMVTSGQTG